MHMSMRETLDKAIAAHAGWKAKFRSFMRGEVDLDPTVVERCDLCDFGKWLSTTGQAELGAAHGEVHAAHAKFHTVAAGVVRQKKAGDTAGAETALSLSGEFTRTSAALTHLVTAIRDGRHHAA